MIGVTGRAGAAERTGRAGLQLQVRELSVTLGRSLVLDGVGLEVAAGSWTAVVGPNGAGKSTLLRAVAGLIRYAGEIRFDDQPARTLPARARATRVGFAPQTPVLPDLITLVEYVSLGRTPYHSLLSGSSQGDAVVVAEVLDRLDLTGLAERRLRTLSGGERQRAVLARALAQQPRLLLLDEPTAALDLGHAQQTLELVDRLRREDGLTVLSTLHDLVLAGQYADRMVLLASGRVVAAGAPAQVLTEAALARHYGAAAEVRSGPEGVRVHPLRPGFAAGAGLGAGPEPGPGVGAGNPPGHPSGDRPLADRSFENGPPGDHGPASDPEAAE